MLYCGKLSMVRLIICTLSVFFFTLNCVRGGDLMPRTQLEFRKIAELEAKKQGFDTRETEVVIDVDRSHPAVSRLIQMLEKDNSMPKELKGKSFAVVYYSPVQKPNQFILGGEFYVFIDRVTKKIFYSMKLK